MMLNCETISARQLLASGTVWEANGVGNAKAELNGEYKIMKKTSNK